MKETGARDKALTISSTHSILVMIDIQERLAPHITHIERVLENSARLLQGARLMNVPVIAVEQYPKGLGKTVDTLSACLEGVSPIEKTTFSAMRAATFVRKIGDLAADHSHIVIFGTETHVCVLQTALDLKAQGHRVFLVGDASGSRTGENHQAALERAKLESIVPVTTEMVLFEWLGDKNNPAFSNMMKLIV